MGAGGVESGRHGLPVVVARLQREELEVRRVRRLCKTGAVVERRHYKYSRQALNNGTRIRLHLQNWKPKIMSNWGTAETASPLVKTEPIH